MFALYAVPDTSNLEVPVNNINNTQHLNSFVAVNTPFLHSRDQILSVVLGNNRRLL